MGLRHGFSEPLRKWLCPETKMLRSGTMLFISELMHGTSDAFHEIYSSCLYSHLYAVSARLSYSSMHVLNFSYSAHGGECCVGNKEVGSA